MKLMDMTKLTAQEIIKYPLISEDAVSLIESENKIVFIVDLKANKKDVTQAIESLYEVEVEEVNTVISPGGIKKAYVKLTPTFKAADLAVKLGIF